jgi:hypothetical protein
MRMRIGTYLQVLHPVLVLKLFALAVFIVSWVIAQLAPSVRLTENVPLPVASPVVFLKAPSRVLECAGMADWES